LQELAQLDEFVEGCARGPGGLQRFAPVLAALGAAPGALQWQLASHVERCYWALSGLPRTKATVKNLNQKVPHAIGCRKSATHGNLPDVRS
jgi:hypothetical protein